MGLNDAVQDALKTNELELPDTRTPITIPDAGGQPIELLIYEPTMEQIAWITSALGHSDLQTKVGRIVDMIQDLLDPEEYEALWIRLRNRHDPLTLNILIEKITDALESMQDFPTPPSSGSSPASSRRKPGARSTGRAAGPGSTQSS